MGITDIDHLIGVCNTDEERELMEYLCRTLKDWDLCFRVFKAWRESVGA